MSYALKFNTGSTITLRTTVGKKGQTFLAARPESEPIVTRFGFNVDLAVVGGKLPTSATLLKDGKAVGSVNLESGTTEGGNAKVTGSMSGIEYEGESHVLSIRISRPKDTTANVLIRSSRPRTGSVHSSL